MTPSQRGKPRAAYAALGVALAITLTACNTRIYLRDGVNDGDTFYLPSITAPAGDPTRQSWLTYSLARSTCQIEMGGENPARNSSFDCELRARKLLVQSWAETRLADSSVTDRYLDALAGVAGAGYLPEYVWHYLGSRRWTEPEGLAMAEFETWRRTGLRRHRARTRIIGSWNYASEVARATAGRSH